MLTALTLDNLALIKHHEIVFDERFNVITGETGAGKSLILDALSLCVGGRADAGMVRFGESEASVFGEFDVTDNDKVSQWFAEHERELEEDTLLIRRKISANGRSKSWINGVPASLSELKSLGSVLVNIHSQHAGLELLKPQFVIDWLDDVGGLHALKSATKDAFGTYQRLKKEADDARAMSTQRADRMALLSSRLSDIEPLMAVDIGEIEQEYDELSNLENLMQSALQAVTHLDNDEMSVSGLLARSLKICDNLSDKSRVFAECSELLTQASEQIDDAVARLMDYAEQSLPDEERLDELNNLMGLAHRFAKKYHTTTDELTAQAGQWQAELEKLENLPDNETMDEQVAGAWDEYVSVADKLHHERTKIAPQIADELAHRLSALALPNASCLFEFSPKEPHQYGGSGMFDIALMFSANVGMPMQPLHKVASGGELSRMALIMQVMSAGVNQETRPTLVFDEVDVGISGGTAQVVGELLRSLGDHQQLFAITHQAQVAAAAHRHILVHKEHGEQTMSHLSIITGDRQIDELARMSGGVNITEATRAHVKGLLDDINKVKMQ
ncbi:DNA repair protein RecN [Moraxella bovis]|uniref:DNA repair protein RecN n=1 Tax=Moraxella bovis TaxID=476 RepID=A0A378PPS0_MORBO|nr:DNA repair protein RecN [Moraxella bovis]UYZ75649.1 DNA repair protein RecN [Moraxella bovis]UYZ78409.1 DNA repair protein RecN [Moraxella bovis]UYZ86891.1 DNA repair protein RecN [Moraxella bovis]UYZ92319.1 DNA repair protein RecN [Moraxella bovis]UYZ97765.1 DNA repair protein RecN [Moraxella bovis]